jgi:hypothetical protein
MFLLFAVRPTVEDFTHGIGDSVRKFEPQGCGYVRVQRRII